LHESGNFHNSISVLLVFTKYVFKGFEHSSFVFA